MDFIDTVVTAITRAIAARFPQLLIRRPAVGHQLIVQAGTIIGTIDVTDDSTIICGLVEPRLLVVTPIASIPLADPNMEPLLYAAVNKLINDNHLRNPVPACELAGVGFGMDDD